MSLSSVNLLYTINFLLILFNFQNFSESFLVRIATPLILLISAIVSLGYLERNNYRINLKKNFLYLVVILFFLTGLLRHNHPEATLNYSILLVISYSSFILLSYNTILENCRDGLIVNEIIYKLLLFPFAIFAAINVLFFYLNISFSGGGHDISIGNAVLLANFGIFTPRIKFAFADGINSFAMGISLMFYISLFSAFFFSYKRLFSIFSLFIFFIILLYTDSRSAIVYPILILILIFILNYFKKYLSIFYCVPFFYIFSPFLMVFLLTTIAYLGIGEDISRSDTEGETGNGRFIMWAISLYEFIDFKLHHIFGYGIFGHYKSGASENWAIIFPSYKNPDIIHPHNSMISMLFDYGYFGVLFYFLFLLNLVKKLINFAKKYFVGSLYLLSFLLLVIFLGMSETIFSSYYGSIMYILLFVFTLISIIVNFEKTINIVFLPTTKKRK